MIPGRTTVSVPEGHEVHVHAPGGMAPLPTGMIADPSAQSALAAMNTALAGAPGAPQKTAARPRSEGGSNKTEPKPTPNKKVKKKKPAKKAATKVNDHDEDD